ncbi:MAG: UDP-glucose 4-epimerase GalE [Pseudomonadota bacterium]
MSKVLVTGGAGYIGSHVVYALLDAGETPVVVDNLTTGNAFAVPSEVRFARLDVGDEAGIMALIREEGIDAVMHFAAFSLVAESTERPLDYYINNTANTAKLWRACQRMGVKHVVFSSTAATYGDVGLEPVAEEAETRPVNPYGWSKLFSEQTLHDALQTSDMEAAILRYFNVAGADAALRTGQATHVATHLVKVAAEVVVGKRTGMTINGDDYATPDGTCVRDYIHVVDLANAHLAALNYLRGGGSTLTLNAGYGHGLSVKQVVDAIGRVTGSPLDAPIGPRRAGDPASIVADVGRIKQILNWSPIHDDIDEIVGSAIAWEQKLLEIKEKR